VAPGEQNDPRHPLAPGAQYTLVDFRRDFPDDEACLQWLWRQQYSQDGAHAFCQRCRTETAFKRYKTKQQRQSWTCTACGLHVHPTAGTIFHKSSTGLHLWFYAMYLMTSTRCGISAKQLERELGVTYKTAHRMSRMIQAQLSAQHDGEPLVRAIEVDHAPSGAKLRLSDKVPLKATPTRAEHREAAQNGGQKKALRVRRDRALRQGPRLSAATNLVSGEVRRLHTQSP
jgi:transposase-like protein